MKENHGFILHLFRRCRRHNDFYGRKVALSVILCYKRGVHRSERSFWMILSSPGKKQNIDEVLV